MSDLERLLELQDHDTTVDQLRHRRGHLPEHSELAEVEQRMADARSRLSEPATQLAEVAARQEVLEREVATAEARITEIDKRLYGGSVTASRELQAMAAEVDALKGRQSALEDDVLAAMEEAEPLAAEVGEIEAELAGAAARAETLREAIAAAQAGIDEELAGVEAERADLARQVPDALRTTYEKLRQKLGGTGAARLAGTSCSGCHLTLPATEIARIKAAPADELIFCDQCGRILVR